MTAWILSALLVLLGQAPSSAAGQAAPAGEPTRAQLEQELEAYRRLLLDWAALTRYGSDNSELKPVKPGENRVVFLGDEITEMWGEGKTPFFPGKPYLNRGVTRQTAAQLLVRFRQDVILVKPKVVVIQTGSNDIASVMGPSPEATIAEHIESMVELAKLHGIRVVLASVTPVCDCTQKLSSRRPAGKILGLNNWIKGYAERSGAVYLDYYSALAQGRQMKPEFTVDGFLPNDAGYAILAPLAEQAIALALSKKD